MIVFNELSLFIKWIKSQATSIKCEGTDVWCHSLKTWARTQDRLQGGCFSTTSRYSSAISHTGGLRPSNRAGLWRFPSVNVMSSYWSITALGNIYQSGSLSVQACLYALPALMTPCTPVSSMHRWTSLRCWMFPLAKMGMFTASLHKHNKRYTIGTKP